MLTHQVWFETKSVMKLESEFGAIGDRSIKFIGRALMTLSDAIGNFLKYSMEAPAPNVGR
jgi:hypothetical protein